MGTFWSTGVPAGSPSLLWMAEHIFQIFRSCLNMVLGTLAVSIPARRGVGPREPRGLCHLNLSAIL